MEQRNQEKILKQNELILSQQRQIIEDNKKIIQYHQQVEANKAFNPEGGVCATVGDVLKSSGEVLVGVDPFFPNSVTPVLGPSLYLAGVAVKAAPYVYENWPPLRLEDIDYRFPRALDGNPWHSD